MNGNYWTRNRPSRRGFLRGAGLGAAGIAGAALIGCGSDDDDVATPTATSTITQGDIQDATPTATASADDTPVPADQVRVAPGRYDLNVPPSAAELNPAVNHKTGGHLLMRYLDPPRMDLNRTLSCTIYHTLDYTNSKLVRGRTGAAAPLYNVELENDLAESVEVTNNSTEFVFNLRQGVMTHDKAPANGREFTSEDVVAGLEMYRAGGTQKDVFAGVTDISAPDDYTVVVKLDAPNGDFVGNQASWSFIYLKELAEDQDLRQEVAVGTGPFVQDQWVKGERSEFVRHANYHEEGLPYVDKVTTFVNNDRSSRKAAFQTYNFYDYDARDDADADDTQGQVDGTVYLKFPRSRGANVNGFQFQMNNPTFQDDRVRQALSLAFDRTEYDLARNAGDNFTDAGAFSNSPMPWSMLFDEYPDQSANGPWYQFDPAEASKMMQAAGYTADNPLEMELVSWYYRNELSELVAPGINQSLPEVNINWRQIDNPTHVTLMSDRNFDDTIGFLWGPPGYSMDMWIYPFYHSSAGNNYGSINDAELDGMLEKQRELTDAAERKEVWQQIWDRLHDKVYQAWFPEPFTRYVWHNFMLNYRPHGMMGSYACYSSDQARSIWLDDDPNVDRSA
jgi:peptide/nickel transport system substrate-binding protein